MPHSNDLFKLPAGPAEICFDKNDFMKKTFSVDEFLQEHKNAATLETMRDDLGLYLKVLRSAMIELINEDYADFVNLSSNLVGLDQSIHGIQSPLGGLKEEILTIKSTLQETMQEVNECLEQKRQLHEQQKSIQSLTRVRRSIEKLETLLKGQLNDDESLDPTILERAVLELIKLKFDMQFCQKHLQKVDHIDGEAKCNELRLKLLSKIEKHFLDVLARKNIDQLERCLRIYCTLGECAVAEDIFQREVVGPYMHPIISEVSLQNCPQGLNGIYNQIFEFVDEKMKQLLALTDGRSPTITTAHVKGFDFFINSFWVEVEHRLETHMTSIFAPGNPDSFFQKYKGTNEFLERMETVCGSQDRIDRLRQHKQYKHFQTKWNLPVYFQIRYQEIAGAVETACSKPITKDTLETSSTGFKLKPFSVTFASISKCWQEGIYLPQIFIRFLKLTLQNVSRISSWAEESSESKNWIASPELNRIDFLVTLYLDVNSLLKRIPSILTVAIENVPIILNTEIPLLEKCFAESKEALELRLAKLESLWQDEILSQTTGWSKQVADIPRLYRKTNRDAPTKACNYVEQILRPAQVFFKQYSSSVDKAVVQNCLKNVFSQITAQYYTSVVDVLTSVQKTEESLRRLKNLRGQTERSTATGMSDDDKIRLQLHVDIVTWTTEIEKLGVNKNQIDKLLTLIGLVEESTKIKTNDKNLN